MKRLRVSTVAFKSGLESSPLEADAYLVQFCYELGVFSLNVGSHLTELELADELIKLANDIRNNHGE